MTTVLVFLASILYKISMHTAGWSSAMTFAGLLAFQHLPYALFLLIVTVLLAGLIGSARLNLKAHSVQEVYSGYMAGLTGMLLSYFIVPHI